MEDQTRFDLNTSIANWRARLEARDAFSPEQLRELETHVRDGTAEWIAKGLTEKEAFGIASTRLGADDALAAEYQKAQPVNVWQTRLFWMLLGSIFIGFVNAFSRFLSALLLMIGSEVTWKILPLPGFKEIQQQQFQTTVYFISTIIGPIAFYFLFKGISRLASRVKIKALYFRSSRQRLGIAFLLAFLAFQQINYILFNLTLQIQSIGARSLASGSYFLLMAASSAGFAILAARTAPDRFLVKRT
jgi:hypothetical protein